MVDVLSQTKHHYAVVRPCDDDCAGIRLPFPPRPFSGTFHNVGSSTNIVTAIKIKAGGGQGTCNTRGTNMCTRIFNRNLYRTEGIRGHYAFYDRVHLTWMRSLLFWDVPQRLFGNYRSTLPNIPRRRRSHLHRGESLQSRINVDLKVSIV
jgi:hypothetical protein